MAKRKSRRSRSSDEKTSATAINFLSSLRMECESTVTKTPVRTKTVTDTKKRMEAFRFLIPEILIEITNYFDLNMRLNRNLNG